MWNASSNLDDWIDTLAMSLTIEVRKHGGTTGSGSTVYDGFAKELAPVIRVQWLWMIYPGILILLSVYYLFHTILTSARDEVSVWKGSALPMLFCRIDPNISNKVGDGMDVPDGLDDRVGNTRVALYRGDDGQWAFKTTTEDGEEDA